MNENVMLDRMTDGDEREKFRLTEAALDQSEQGLWSESVASNRAILTIDPEDVSALNRLGRSLTKLGQLREALEAYEGAIAVDPANAISLRNSARLRGVLEILQDDTVSPSGESEVRAEHFIMETGRSAVLALEDLSPVEQIATILPGDVLELKSEGPYLKLYTRGGGQVGIVPADRAHRVMELMAAGNKYQAVVVTASVDGVRVLIRETHRSPDAHGKLPFPSLVRQAAETRAALRAAELDLDDEFVREPDIDEDAEEPEESPTEPLAEADDVDEPEE